MSYENTVKTSKTRAELIEFIVVIMLGITAVATAWSSWQEGLHGSLMDQKYTKSNNLASEGNSEYNAAIQSLTQDMMIYNEVNGLLIDMHFAESKGDMDEYERLEWKFDEILAGSVSEELYGALVWAMDEAERLGESVSPFVMEGFMESYFDIALELLAQSEEMLEEGNANNTHGDNQGLVTVLYAMVLFLLGMSTSIKRDGTKYLLLVISGIAFIGTTIFMFTIPIVFP